ncbi:MAG: DUF4416 family protein [Candidatus Omnitrophica bacterium]|nr:DUF4416 family protein [Candidatus Omnitrophota bacterium]MDD5488798.1 DUF4416 family protein [Candidatus Omnitrophota bacterium]
MGKIGRHKTVKLIASLIFGDEGMLALAEKALLRRYGPVRGDMSRMFPFDYTDYYEEELGGGLRRKLICFERNVDIASAPDIKIHTNRVEERLSRGGRRTVNIDPGYVTEAKLVLLTTKDYNHRIYVGKNIYAECTLHFRKGTFTPWPWTYPDYASGDLVGYFNLVREIYMREIRNNTRLP